MMRKSLFIGYLLVYVFSASVNYFFVKFGLKYATPLGYMAIRYAIAGSLLAIATMTINGKYYLILNRDLALLSLFSSLSSALWAYGLLYIDPGSSAIFGYTMPLFAIPLSILLIREKPRTLNVVGSLVGFVGVIIYGVSSIMKGVSLVGALLTIMNAVFWALYSIYFKKLGNNNGLIVVSNMFIIGSLILAVMGILVDGLRTFTGIEWVPGFVSNLLGTSVIGGVVLFLVWYLLVNTVGVANSTPYIFTVPALTLALNYFIMGIQPTLPEIIGSAIMFMGIYLASI
ncbi:EamA family transporter [Vulcanisaeta souniana JCM 11219]|uniref:EamA family transporter n=2 Tax=Vulcanisaeta souniana JCM 11219 TaxID=1293586 RepID=A0A830EFG7_9CREN|nr:EamA family transporter [Vulcanisaeta souniana JCM 11219]